jgi:hypothetical protein
VLFNKTGQFGRLSTGPRSSRDAHKNFWEL